MRYLTCPAPQVYVDYSKEFRKVYTSPRQKTKQDWDAGKAFHFHAGFKLSTTAECAKIHISQQASQNEHINPKCRQQIMKVWT